MAYPESITYPLSGNYPSLDLQEWYFFPTVKGNKLTFTMDSIDTQSGLDVVTVSEFAVPNNRIYGPDAPILQAYDGTSVGTPVESSIGFIVRFTSSGSDNRTGFTFTISESTGGSLPLTSLDYPAGSGNYSSNDRLIWYFEDGVINFSAFRTEEGYDFIRVYEVNGNVAPTLLSTLEGTSIPSEITTTKRLLFFFISDTGLEDTGFVLSFTPNASGDEELEPNNTVHSHTANNVVLTINTALAVNNTVHGHVADNVLLAVNNNLSVNSTAHGHTAGNVALAVNYVLEVASTVHGHTADTVNLDSGITLEVSNALHQHIADNVALSVNHNLEVVSAFHNHIASAVNLNTNTALQVANATHSHSADNVILGSGNDLVVANTVHNHTSDRVVLAVNYNLEVADAVHIHTANDVVLSSNITLEVNNCVHSHKADNVVLDGIYTGEILSFKSTITTAIARKSIVTTQVMAASLIT